MKVRLILILLLSTSFSLKAQGIVENFTCETINKEKLEKIKSDFGLNKSIPKLYENQILIALSYYPELKNTAIIFRIKKNKTPLTSRPRLVGLLQSAKKRQYIITISNQSDSLLQPILFNELSFNAQIGVLGHELSHISDYSSIGFAKMSVVLLNVIFSKKKVDAFETKTDFICINHGLGYQLLDWSKTVRKNMKVNYWRGANNLLYNGNKERYLNPETIQETIDNLVIYNNDNGFLKTRDIN